MRRTGTGARLRVTAALAVLVAVSIPALAHGAIGDTTLASRASGADGAVATGASQPGLALSGSGRYIAFASTADNLDAAAVAGVANVYVRDTETGTTTLVSRADGADGAGGDGNSANPSISPAGRYVAFESEADNLSDSDDDSVTNVYVRDLVAGTTTLVSRADTGPADGPSHNPSIAANGAFVAFESTAANLSDQDDDTTSDVFVRDISGGTTTLVSRPATGAANGNSYDPSISSNGLKVAFTSDADNLMNVDVDSISNIYVYDLRFRFLVHASRSTISGIISHPADGNSFAPSLSPDGRDVAFVSRATNLADGANGAVDQVFVRDLQANLTTLVSRASGVSGAPGDGQSSRPTVSREGRVVSFVSQATNLSDEDGAGADVFLRAGAPVQGGTLSYDTTLLASRASGATGAAADGDVRDAVLSTDATALGFVSTATNLGIDNPGGLPLVFSREFHFAAHPPPPPDLGSNDHSAHEGHGADHTGHTAGGTSVQATGPQYTLRMGQPGKDRITGTQRDDKVCGLGGNDVIHLEGGADVAYGDMCGAAIPPVDDTAAIAGLRAAPPPGGASGNDSLIGGTGNDQLYGGWGNDRLVGGSGDDAMYGGVGRDRLIGGPGSNIYRAGPGRDSINAANGTEDLVDCGSGRDTARVDRIDFVKGCEHVRRIGKAKRGTNKKDTPQQQQQQQQQQQPIDPSLQLPECPGGGHACHEGSSGVVVVSRASRR
jgi:Tol biopolymer transport system component